MHNVLVINRWSDEFGDYRPYLDHRAYKVSYLTDKSGREALTAYADDEIAQVRIADLTNRSQAVQLSAELSAEVGGFAHVLALSEYDIVLGAAVRDALGVPGLTPAQARAVCDKTEMKRRMNRAGVPVPAWGPAERGRATELFAEGASCVVLKPRHGAASVGVSLHQDVDSLTEALRQLDDTAGYECEEYVPGPVFHVDGVLDGSSVRYAVPSAYLNTCLDFAQGRPLGSVTVDDPRLRRELTDFTERCLAALGLTDSAFHLECIAGPRGLTFLEVGARVGGGEIPFNFKDVHGRDIVKDWVGVQLGRPVAELPPLTEASGFLMFPEPSPRPCEIRRVSMPDPLPTCYASQVPAVGEVFDGHGGYDHIGGRFRFRASDAAAIDRDIATALLGFGLEAKPLQAADEAGWPR